MPSNIFCPFAFLLLIHHVFIVGDKNRFFYASSFLLFFFRFLISGVYLVLKRVGERELNEIKRALEGGERVRFVNCKKLT
jgi:uncharacterized metal-binding protein